jgi:hypothetical protein
MASLSGPFTASNVDTTTSHHSGQLSVARDHSNPWAEFFGETNKSIAPGRYTQEVNDLPDAYVGKNSYLTQILIREITQKDVSLMQILPFKRMEDGIEIHWDVIKFNDHMLNRRPEESVSRLVTMERQQDSASFVSYGIAMLLEHGFHKTPEGQMHYAMHLKQISNATIETACFGAANALLEAGDALTFETEEDGEVLTFAEFRSQLQKERDQFGAFQCDVNGVMVVWSRLKQVLVNRGVREHTFTILPAGGLKYVTQTRPEYKGSSDALVSTMGAVSESRPFIIGDKCPNLDPFFRIKSIGSFYTALAIDSVGIKKEKYCSAMRTISTWSEDDDDFHAHTLGELLSACMLGEEDIQKKVNGGWFTTALLQAPALFAELTGAEKASLAVALRLPIVTYTEDSVDEDLEEEQPASPVLVFQTSLEQYEDMFRLAVLNARTAGKRATDDAPESEGSENRDLITRQLVLSNTVEFGQKRRRRLILALSGVVRPDSISDTWHQVVDALAETDLLSKIEKGWYDDQQNTFFDAFPEDVNKAILTVLEEAGKVVTEATKVAIVEDPSAESKNEASENSATTSMEPESESSTSDATLAEYETFLKAPNGNRILAYFRWCDANNIRCPVSFLILSPDMQFECGTMMVGKGGGELGYTYYGWPDFELGKNANQKMLFGHFTVNLKSVILNKMLLATADDVYIRKYIGGAGHVFKTTPGGAGDLYACIVPEDWVPPCTFLDVVGTYNPNVVSIADTKPQWPTAGAYKEIWKFHHSSYEPERGSGQTNTNTIVWQGAQRLHRYGANQVVSPHMITNRGHLGTNVYPSCAGVRRGAAMYLLPINYNNTSVNAVVM